MTDIDDRLEELQTQLLKLASSKANYEKVGDKIYRLCEEKQKLQLESTDRDEVKKQITDLGIFLREQPTAIAEYDESLVRGLIEKVTIYDNKFTVELKSDVTVNVEV